MRTTSGEGAGSCWAHSFKGSRSVEGTPGYAASVKAVGTRGRLRKDAPQLALTERSLSPLARSLSRLSDGSVTAQSGAQLTEPSPKKVPPPLEP